MSKKHYTTKCHQMSNGQIFCFTTIQEKLKTIKCIEDKIAFLLNAKTDFLQCDNPISNKHGKSFDEKIDLEIQRLEKLEAIRKSKEQSTAHNNSKLIINGSINTLASAFYQMMQTIKTNGKPYLDYSIREIATFICNNFKDRYNNELSIQTIQAYLCPTKPHKRPKKDKSPILDTIADFKNLS